MTQTALSNLRFAVPHRSLLLRSLCLQIYRSFSFPTHTPTPALRTHTAPEPQLPTASGCLSPPRRSRRMGCASPQDAAFGHNSPNPTWRRKGGRGSSYSLCCNSKSKVRKKPSKPVSKQQQLLRAGGGRAALSTAADAPLPDQTWNQLHKRDHVVL